MTAIRGQNKTEIAEKFKYYERMRARMHDVTLMEQLQQLRGAFASAAALNSQCEKDASNLGEVMKEQQALIDKAAPDKDGTILSQRRCRCVSTAPSAPSPGPGLNSASLTMPPTPVSLVAHNPYYFELDAAEYKQFNCLRS